MAKPTDKANFDFVCDVCGIDQGTFDQSILHYKQVHNRIGYIKCCKKKFFKECTVDDHIKWHESPDLFKYVNIHIHQYIQLSNILFNIHHCDSI